MNQLVKKGSVERAYLGVQIGEVTKELAAKFGVKRGEGVLVAEVMPNTPASKAGFKDGDVITRFGDHKVRNPRELQELVERVPLDTKETVEVQRDGKSVPLSVTVKALPKQLVSGSDKPAESEDEADEPAGGFSSDKLGLTVSEVSKEQLDSLGFKGHSGVVITKVDPEGLAAEQGLREGMLITEVGKKVVKTTSDFEDAVKHESLKEGVMLKVRTRQGNRYVVVQQS
jgi:serine protease Do